MLADWSAAGEQYTAAFLLTRGIYAWIGFEWAGCRSTFPIVAIPLLPCTISQAVLTGIHHTVYCISIIYSDCTAELTQGTYVLLGVGNHYPRPKEWDADYGVPLGNCSAVSGEDGKFVRHFSKATVTWDCHNGTGSITL